jgi:hypothetical protein
LLKREVETVESSSDVPVPSQRLLLLFFEQSSEATLFAGVVLISELAEEPSMGRFGVSRHLASNESSYLTIGGTTTLGTLLWGRPRQKHFQTLRHLGMANQPFGQEISGSTDIERLESSSK